MTDEPNASSSAPSGPAPRLRRRWRWLLLAVLPLLLFGVTECLEVTTLTPAAALLHGECLLVVAAADPLIEVTIAGEGLVSRARGSREVRLPPGRYELWGIHRGKIPKEEWLTLARDERHTWQVDLPPRPAPLRPAARPFVLLAHEDEPEEQFDTLAEAIGHAPGGATIEVHGNGPFEMDPIRIRGKTLALRAGDGFWPILRLKPQATSWLLDADAGLVLEGLEFDGMTVPAEEGKHRGQLYPTGALYVANCRFKQRGPSSSIGGKPPVLELLNCDLDVSPHSAIVYTVVPHGRFGLENCLFRNATVVTFDLHAGSDPATLRLARNTQFRGRFRSRDKLEPGKFVPMQLELAENIFHKHATFTLNQLHADVLPVAQVRSLVQDLIRLREERCLHSPAYALWRYAVKYSETEEGALRTLEDWQQFWKTDTPGSLQEVVKFHSDAPHELEDYRLAKDSPGKGAGKDGRDLGADLDLVGPGPAYERWKKTPGYQEWLKKVEKALTKELGAGSLRG